MSKVNQLRSRSNKYRQVQIQRGGHSADSSQVIMCDALIEILATLEALQDTLGQEPAAVSLTCATSPETIAKSKGGSK